MDASSPEEVLLDANKEAKAYEFYTVGEIEARAQSADLIPSHTGLPLAQQTVKRVAEPADLRPRPSLLPTVALHSPDVLALLPCHAMSML